MRHRTARMLMAPGLAGFSLFYLLPLGMTCFYAFVRSPFDATFVALDNLAKVLMNSYFQMALQHTAFFTLISVGTVMLLSVFLTFFLANSSYKLHAPFMLPVLLPTVAVCLIWNVLFGRGSLLESLGIPVEASLYTLFLFCLALWPSFHANPWKPLPLTAQEPWGVSGMSHCRSFSPHCYFAASM